MNGIIIIKYSGPRRSKWHSWCFITTKLQGMGLYMIVQHQHWPSAQTVLRLASATVGLCTAVCGPTLAEVSPLAFCTLGVYIKINTAARKWNAVCKNIFLHTNQQMITVQNDVIIMHKSTITRCIIIVDSLNHHSLRCIYQVMVWNNVREKERERESWYRHTK